MIPLDSTILILLFALCFKPVLQGHKVMLPMFISRSNISYLSQTLTRSD